MAHKKPLKEIIADNNKAMDFYAAISGRPSPKRPAEVESKPRAPRAKSYIPNEHDEQKNFVRWFKMQYPKVRIFSVPNAASRSYELAAYLRAEGLSPGCPDLWIPEWRMAIEMKRTKGGAVSDEQKAWLEYLLGIGWKAHVCKGFDEAKTTCIAHKKIYD